MSVRKSKRVSAQTTADKPKIATKVVQMETQEPVEKAVNEVKKAATTKTKTATGEKQNTVKLRELELDKIQKLQQNQQRLSQIATELGQAVVNVELQKDFLKSETIKHNQQAAELDYELSQAYPGSTGFTQEGEVILPPQQE